MVGAPPTKLLNADGQAPKPFPGAFTTYPSYMGKAGDKWKEDYPDLPNPDRSFHVKLSDMKANQAKISEATALAPPATPNENKRFSMIMRFDLDDVQLKDPFNKSVKLPTRRL